MSEAKTPLRAYLSLVGLALIWGASFLLIKIAVQDMSPEALVLIRSAAGCAALAIFVALMGRPLFGQGWRTRIVPYVILALTGGLLPWILIAWGETRISSGLASILNSTTPFWAAVLIFWVIPKERPSAINYVGVLVGLAGVAILVAPDLTARGMQGDVVGALAVVLASLSYAVSALYQRIRLRGVSVYEVSLGQLAATTLMAIPVSAPALPEVHWAPLSVAAVIALGIFGSGVAYLLYYYMLNTIGPVRATGVTLLVPVTAVFWGVVLLHEALTLPIVAGMIVILAGIVLTNLRRRERHEPAAEAGSEAA